MVEHLTCKQEVAGSFPVLDKWLNSLCDMYYRLDITSPYTEIELSATTSQYTVGNLGPATEYIFMVSAVNGAGTSDVSNVLAAKTFDAGKILFSNTFLWY